MLEWIQENLWLVWLVLAGGLAVSEMLTLDMTLLMLAGGALAGAGVALVFPGLLWVQVLVAVVVRAVLAAAGLGRAEAPPGEHDLLGDTRSGQRDEAFQHV